MNKLNGKAVDKLPYSNIRKVADLTYFDGPLLSLFHDHDNRSYIYYWYDADETCNRWLVFQILDEQVEGYITQALSLYDMIMNPPNGHLFAVDIDGNGNHLSVSEIRPSELPNDTLPAQGTYFDPCLSTFYEQEIYSEILAIVLEDNRKLRRSRQTPFPHKWQAFSHEVISRKHGSQPHWENSVTNPSCDLEKLRIAIWKTMSFPVK